MTSAQAQPAPIRALIPPPALEGVFAVRSASSSLAAEQVNGKRRGVQLPLRKVFRIGGEFRIGAGSQLIQVHALPLALCWHALWVKPVQKPVQAVGQRQYKAEQCGDARKLRYPLV